ncbi:predicted protein [Phaeodactylum tricornutum CCAP 1055/1]|jgi:hypothetical protein|uniref:Uncharacterized protein n=1 Tax=Phaeodactylum tricornutum (strain CCAP 1055/1) TaxID=556484 RepID=B5Y5V1_PHATC|nr:predicted protein [Phaeodactylum tricornutum CCAP 1055/1]ACI65722.1 predicted protein [Phaeodactylum tricornutum CCAP 1055/1]|eukprot:XP_002186252.1 predicted protein [Phaeodactylum tricornutum CCAP 1055/1]
MRRPRKVTPAVPAPAAATDSPADAASASEEDEEFGGFDSSDGEEPSGTAPPSPASSDDEGDGKKTAKPLARSKNTSDEVVLNRHENQQSPVQLREAMKILGDSKCGGQRIVGIN